MSLALASCRGWQGLILFHSLALNYIYTHSKKKWLEKRYGEKNTQRAGLLLIVKRVWALCAARFVS